MAVRRRCYVLMKGRLYDKLCAIDDTGRASALSEQATVSCGLCGAGAYDADSVCEPIPLPKSARGGSKQRK